MKIIKAKYIKNESPNIYHIVYLGTRDNKIIGIDANKMSDEDISRLRKDAGKLKYANLETLLSYCKNYLPISYKNAIRGFDANKFATLATYEIKPS